MTQQSNEKHLSKRTTNILLGASVVILIASVLIRYLIASAPQEGVLVLMGIGVFLFLLVAFDQPS